MKGHLLQNYQEGRAALEMNWYRHIQIWKRKKIKYKLRLFLESVRGEYESIMQGERQGRQEGINPARANRNDCLTAWMNEWLTRLYLFPSSLTSSLLLLFHCMWRKGMLDNAECRGDNGIGNGNGKHASNQKNENDIALHTVDCQGQTDALESRFPCQNTTTVTVYRQCSNSIHNSLGNNILPSQSHTHTYIQSWNLQFIDTVQ